MFERFTDRARRVLVLAQQESHLWQHGFIGTEHLLVAMAEEGEGVAHHVLRAHGLEAEVLRADMLGHVPAGRLVDVAAALATIGIDLDRVRAAVEESLGPGAFQMRKHPPFTPRAKERLQAARDEAVALGHDYIGTEHLLLGLLSGESLVDAIMAAHDVSATELRRTTIALLASFSQVRDTPAWHAYDRLTVAVPRLADPHRSTFAEILRRVVYPAQAAAIAALADDAATIEDRLGNLAAGVDAAREELAEAGLLSFIDLVPVLLETPAAQRLAANRQAASQALSPLMDGDSEEFVRVFKIGRDIRELETQAWVGVLDEAERATTSELAERLGEIADQQDSLLAQL